jgi:hypothetical protein
MTIFTCFARVADRKPIEHRTVILRREMIQSRDWHALEALESATRSFAGRPAGERRRP